MGNELKLSCQYNEGVKCSMPRDCEKCGWNPAVEQKRLLEWLLEQRRQEALE